jgi:hypothetical protein
MEEIFVSATIHELKPTKTTKTKKREKPQMTELPGYKKHMEGLDRRNISYQETATTISDDGEILEQNFKTISKAKEDDFIKLYLSDIGYLHKLQPNQQELLYYFLQNMNYNNLIVINKTIKEMIAKESNKSYRTVENALTSYVDTGIFLRQGRGVYIANPYLFGKGRFEDIQKIRMEIVYTSEGLKLRSQIEKRDEE